MLRLQQAIGHRQQRAFARTACPQQGNAFTGLNPQRDPIEAGLLAAGHVDATQLQHGAAALT
jgi:hypothetical protein